MLIKNCTLLSWVSNFLGAVHCKAVFSPDPQVFEKPAVVMQALL